jgi:hypothetical protein
MFTSRHDEEFMPHHHELATEKYWNESVETEIKELTLQKNREASRAFLQFVGAVAIFSVTVLAVQQMPNWLPFVASYFEQSSIPEVFN